jgi:hypothetical protein
MDNNTQATPQAPANDFLQLARDAFSASTTWFDASVRRQMESNIRQFQGVHPAGSKYHSDTYKNRSKLFRPKTRAAVRKNEAVACEAFFSNADTVVCEAENDADPQQRAAAKLIRSLLQYRLEKSIPWFMLVMGAYQDAQISGCVSYQYWKYDVERGIDKPCVDLFPLENLRIDPGADWSDPINSSPYVIRLIPMYVKDVKARMRPDSKTGYARWKPVSDSDLLAAASRSMDTTRLTRERGRTDPKDNSIAINAFTIVWVHLNVMEVDGRDMVWYTLGDIAQLSDPKPIKEVWWHGIRPFALGYAAIEAHKLYPEQPVGMGKDTQAEINEVANQRIDNVKFAMNKRYFARRNGQVDLRSITRNVPGSVTLMTDIEKDVKVLDTNDVTSSAYQEQDRLNVDFDDVMGAFSPSTIQSNRKMNETVGGLELLDANTNQVGAYQLRTFVETWVKPVLRQLGLLEAHYETDDVVLQLAVDKARLSEEFMLDPEGQTVIERKQDDSGATVDGIPLDYLTNELMHQDLVLKVNVNYGSTNPKQQINDFLTAMRALKELLMDGILERYGLNIAEVIKELFGKLGYDEGKRFFNPEKGDPALLAAQATIAELQQQLSQKVDPALVAKQVEKLDAEITSLSAKNAKVNAEIENLGAKNHDILAGAMEKVLRGFFAGHQIAQMVATVPALAPVADSVIDAAATMSGNKPTPGVTATAPEQALPGITQNAVKDPRTGIEFTPADGAAVDTTPSTPATPGGPSVATPSTPGAPTPATPGTGANTGIETVENDS